MSKICWFTGFSGSGKTTIAEAVQAFSPGHLFLIDGDVLRSGLCRDVGYSLEGRKENIRRAAEVACLAANAGMSVLAALITPTEGDRDQVRAVVGDRFPLLWIHIATPLEECERRDVKGLYRRARAGELPYFTGITAPFEIPINADLTLNSSLASVRECASAVWNLLNPK